jgi:N utilization substance protein B
MAKPPGKRREGRQAAMQYLFAHDLHGAGEVSDTERNAFWDLHMAKNDVREYAERLIKGILTFREEIDSRIASVLQNFSFERLGTVDRNILRLAVYEMLHEQDVPRPVVINEAIEIAKAFGDTQTRVFVNGVLDRIAKTLPPVTTAG